LGGLEQQRPFPPLAEQVELSRLALQGSLWRPHVGANYLFVDTRARFVGDLLTVVISESAKGKKEATTKGGTKSDVNASLEELFGLTQQLSAKNPDIDPSQLIKASTERTFEGDGSTEREGSLTARITVRVEKVAPNGNLWVEGQEVVSVNGENQLIEVSGWVRPEDIGPNNEVLSWRLADARIDFYGAGEVSLMQRRGWMTRVLDVVWPF